ncbi:InlB B-repeat-containing protein [Anaeromyxobacter diazotrophicus]|nr:hypothetical protein [Anaeromyxobacter diazotrophicus]
MDKTSYFFTFQCGICHPGGGPTQYDRDGQLYWNGTQFGYGGGVAALPDAAKLDGDYGFIAPKNVMSADGLTVVTPAGTPIPAAGWKKNGVLQADCLMCHLAGYSWKNRAATLAGGAGLPGVAAFKVAPTMGAGWGTVTIAAAPAFPPTASAVGPVDYALGVTGGTLVVDAQNQLVIPLGKIGPTPQANCRGCHAIPDTKKSGRTLAATNDVHTAAAIGCTACHPNAAGVPGGRLEHQIGKGDITIGSVRDDLDNTGLSCADCHLGGKAPAGLFAPDPTRAHASIAPLHFAALACQACHVRYMEDDPSTTSVDVPELVYEMSTTGSQKVSTWDRYFASVGPAGAPFRWYPAVRSWKGKLTTVKPLLTAYYGDWLSGTGDGAIIRPLPLRLVRKVLTGAYPPGGARLGALPLTGGGPDAANPVQYRRSDIQASLTALAAEVDTANDDPAADKTIAVRPVLIRAGKVYYLDDAGKVEFFDSAVAESHDFAINHNVVPKRDPADPSLKPGPYGAGGCTDCHSAGSTFFFGKQLIEPAEDEFLDAAGTVPNPNAGQPRFIARWEAMGYSEFRVASLTGERVPVAVRMLGSGPGSTVTGGGIDCRFAGGLCTTTVAQGSALVLTANPGVGAAISSWAGCTSVSADELTCTLSVAGGATGLNTGKVVTATFGAPAQTTPVTGSGLNLSVVGTGWGTVSGGGFNCNLGTQGACNGALADGTLVTLTATPGPNTALVSWQGCTPSAGAPAQCTVTVAGTTAVTALFSNGSGGGPYSPTQALVVTVGSLVAHNTITGGGIACASGTGGTCRIDPATGSTITLTAAPAAGSAFLRFEGCTSTPTPTTCTVTMTQPTHVTGYFSP